MSHTTTVNLEVKDVDALLQACADLGYFVKRDARVRLYDGTVVEDCISVQPPRWVYPIAIKDGAVRYDNYNGAWGDEGDVRRLKQRYARNAVVNAARRTGRRVVEEKAEDGRIRLRVRK